MEKKLKFNSQVCTNLEQSKKLLELGLKPETADCMYSVMTKSYNGRYILEEDRQYNLILFRQEEVQSVGFSRYEHIPAWSMHRLIEMLPTEITHDDCSLILGINATCVYYADDEYAETFQSFEGDLYEYISRCIEWLISEGYFNKEYLKQ